MAAKKADNFTGLRAWRTNTLTLPQFPMLRVGVGKAPLFDSQKRMPAKMVDPDTGDKLERRYLSPTGSIFRDGEVKKVYEYEGVDVELSESELANLKLASDSDISLSALVDEGDISPELYEKSYALWPRSKSDAEGYGLIAALLAESGKALVGTVTEDGTTKGYVVRYSSFTGTLVAHVLAYYRNLRGGQVQTIRDAMENVPAPSDEMLAMGRTIFATLEPEAHLDEIEDEFAARLESAVAAKAQGQAVTAPVAVRTAEDTPDLLAALRASMAEVA